MAAGLLALLVGLAGYAGRLGAADLIEPADSGFSEVDVAVFAGDSAFDSGGQLYAGFGLGQGLSVWVGGDILNGGPVRGGANVMVTRTLARGMDLDLWLDLGVHSATHEAEIGRTDWSLGSEWSVVVGLATPYLRLDWYGDGGDHTVHLLSGIVVPVGALEVHVELSSEEPDGGAWPVHLAVGPNVWVSRRVELQPELSILSDPGSGGTHWAVSLGLIVGICRH